jgi:hypothetical protein
MVTLRGIFGTQIDAYLFSKVSDRLTMDNPWIRKRENGTQGPIHVVMTQLGVSLPA